MFDWFIQARGTGACRACEVRGVRYLRIAHACGPYAGFGFGLQLAWWGRWAGDAAAAVGEHSSGQLDGDGEHGGRARTPDRDAAG